MDTNKKKQQLNKSTSTRASSTYKDPHVAQNKTSLNLAVGYITCINVLTNSVILHALLCDFQFINH